MACELNHVQKAVQGKVGIYVCATDDLKKAGNIDSSSGSFEKVLRYLPPMMNQLGIFEIDKTTRQLDVKSFYEAFFADKKDYSEIEFQNSSELNKDDERIYDAIRKLITDICARLKTDLSTTNTVHQENIQSYIMSDHLGTE